MITVPSGWQQYVGAHFMALFPPERGGRIRYYERLRPARSFRHIVNWIVEQDPLFRIVQIGRQTRLATQEGEQAALVVMDGVRGEERMRRTIGAVFTEEFSAALDGLAYTPERFALFERATRDLLEQTTFGLGLRRRYFYYEPPPRWQALPMGLVAHWYPPDFPNNRSNIMVLPALPMAPGIIDSLSAGLEIGIEVANRDQGPLQAAVGLEGHYRRLRGSVMGQPGQTVLRELAIFVVGRYIYALRFESFVSDRTEELQAVFAAMVASVRPLPSPPPTNHRPEIPSVSAMPVVVDFWAD